MTISRQHIEFSVNNARNGSTTVIEDEHSGVSLKIKSTGACQFDFGIKERAR